MDVCGKRAIVRTVRENIHGVTGELTGVILKEVDWLVGCPLFKDDATGAVLGLYYDCELVKLIEDSTT